MIARRRTDEWMTYRVIAAVKCVYNTNLIRLLIPKLHAFDTKFRCLSPKWICIWLSLLSLCSCGWHVAILLSSGIAVPFDSDQYLDIVVVL